jgi:hypothetical protein
MVFPAPSHLKSLQSSRDCCWTIQLGIPNVGTSPYRSDRTDHITTAQDSTIDFSDITGPAGTACGRRCNTNWSRFVPVAAALSSAMHTWQIPVSRSKIRLQ